MELYNIPELKRKAELGRPLTEGEANTLREHLTIEAMRTRSFDFGEIEARLGAGIEGRHLLERNHRWAKMGPKRPAPGPYPYDRSPAYMGPFIIEPGGTERMLARFFAKLDEIKETGKL